MNYMTTWNVLCSQVVLCKFHTAFLTDGGHVYTCGHGRGGRLGHGDEQTHLVSDNSIGV